MKAQLNIYTREHQTIFLKLFLYENISKLNCKRVVIYLSFGGLGLVGRWIVFREIVYTNVKTNKTI